MLVIVQVCAEWTPHVRNLVQLLQTMARDLLEVNRLWTHGVPNDRSRLERKVQSFVSAAWQLGNYVGFSPLIPKMHELLHAGYDLDQFGPASLGASAGNVARS